MEERSCKFVKWVREYRIVAIVRGLESALCDRLAGALFDGGIRMMEVTFDQTGKLSQEETADAIRGLGGAWQGKMLIGAGTVLPFSSLSWQKGRERPISLRRTPTPRSSERRRSREWACWQGR